MATPQAVVDFYRAQGIPARLPQVIPNGRDWSTWDRLHDAEKIRKHYELPWKGVSVGALGRVCSQKGQDVFAKAVGRISQEEPLRFLVVRDGMLATGQDIAQDLDRYRRALPSWFMEEYAFSGLFPVAVLDGRTGKPLTQRDLLADLGDYLPFLDSAGAKEYVDGQVTAVGQWLIHSARIWNHQWRRGGIPLPPHEDSFDYSDLLLGLITCAEVGKRSECLKLAEQMWALVHRRFGRDGVLCNWFLPYLGWRVPLAESVGGMYIELLVDLSRCSGKMEYLEEACGMADRWLSVPFFREHGIFPTAIPLKPWLNTLGLGRHTRQANLSKHNTTMAEALIALTRATGDSRYRNALRTWLHGFDEVFLREDGGISQIVTRQGSGWLRDPALLTGAVVIDVLCDAYEVLGDSEPLNLARRIADYWLGQRAPETGLIPLREGGRTSHVDALTDFAVSLWRLADATGEMHYRRNAETLVQTQLSYHLHALGLVNGVDVQDGRVVDTAIETRFTALFMKVVLLYERNGRINGDTDLKRLLRDR